MPKSSTRQAESSDQGGRPVQPVQRTKAGWLLEASLPDIPDFPLHPELVASMPDGLTGRMPKSADDLFEGWEP